MKYDQDILARLHQTLYEITAEIQRVCTLLDIDYFAQGGTAIGTLFYGQIIPWDDDVDLGMTRQNYERFLKEAPAVLGEGYELVEFCTTPETPFYWAKVCKRGTLFEEYGMEWSQHPQGIFVDIFPFDKVPNNQLLQRLHRAEARWWISAFSLQVYWTRRADIPAEDSLLGQKGWLSRALLWVLYNTCSRGRIYRIMCRVMGRYNRCRKPKYVNIVRMPRDQIEINTIENYRTAVLGPLQVRVPDRVEEYLRHHYPGLQKDIPKERQINHEPHRLSFDTQNEKIYE